MKAGWTTAVLALVWALTACQGEGIAQEAAPSGPDVTQQGAEAAEPGAGATVPSAAGAAAGAFDGPLEELLGWVTTGITLQQTVDRQRVQEEAIAACMHAEGFDYTPQVASVSDIVILEGPVRGTPEFVAAAGYGIWNLDVQEGGGITIPTGANDWRLGAPEMSEAERDAYLTALLGPVTEEFPDGSTIRSGGCTESATDPTAQDDTLRAISAAAQEYLTGLPLDSAFDELNAEWAGCMRQAGYPEASPYLAQQRFLDLLDEQYEAHPGEDVHSGELARELAAEEMAVALADLACQQEVGYVARYDAIDLALQEEYLAAHRADLEALAAALEP